MNRRALLAAPLLAPTLAASPFAPTSAAAQTKDRAVMEEHMVPARDPGIQLYVRNKRPQAGVPARPDRTLLFVHGATYPAHTAFDLPLGGASWMDHIAEHGFDVWCMDLRGYGRSTRPPEMDRPAGENPPVVRGETAVQDIAAVAEFIRQRRNLPRLVHMGWSWGTVTMGRFAADNPDLVERLVLFAPVWIRQGQAAAALAGPGQLGAYRTVARQQARDRWLRGVPEDKKEGLIPPGWFEQWSEATWATDPEGARQNPPVLRAPNGVLQDLNEYFFAGRPYYDPAKITAPTLLAVAEWDQDTPTYMAHTLFPLLTSSPGKRLVILGEGTHTILMERNRMALFRTVQAFLEEARA